MSDTTVKLQEHSISRPMSGSGAPDYAVGRLLLRRKQVGTWRIELPAGKVFGSHRAFEIFGLPPSETPLSFEQVFAGFFGPDRQEAAALLMQAIENKCGFQFTLRVKSRDSKLLHVECFGDVELSPAGHVKSVVGTISDVTKQINADRVALSRSLMLTAMLKRIPAAIAILDMDMNYIHVSEHWAVGHGAKSAAELKGLNHYEVQSDMITDEMRREHKQVLSGATLNRERSLIRDSKGEPISQTCVMTPWFKVREEVGGMIIMLSKVDTRHEIEPSGDLPTKDEFSQLLDHVA